MKGRRESENVFHVGEIKGRIGQGKPQTSNRYTVEPVGGGGGRKGTTNHT